MACARLSSRRDVDRAGGPATGPRNSNCDLRAIRYTGASSPEDSYMMMSDNQRKRIVAAQRKLKNATKRAAKTAKRERNSAK